jgi:antitoxin (DNA-binding transcriptional repressor) of toxin-antitoxin stability system
MRSVGIKVLKNKLSEYVRMAAGGETVLVTDRDRVVAELVPPREHAGRSAADARWAELVRQGVVTPAKNPRKGPLQPPRKPVMSFEELMAELEQDREDRC